MADSLEAVTERHNRQIDAQVNGFERSLSNALGHAESQVVAELTSRLSIVDGLIAPTPANQAVLRSVGTILDKELARAGYQRVIQGFVNDFGGQIQWFQEILGHLSAPLGEQLRVQFSGTDHKFFVQR
ncbi:MAG TPA: hypothetical protein VNH18_25260, partial [Bryobacteraceae bacterium]|nr:hypothetical protein [Bryobacteraceae bacterium]